MLIKIRLNIFVKRTSAVATSGLAHCTTDMALQKTVYNLLFKRTSTFALTIIVGAVVFERVFDQVGDGLFEQLNRGKLWKHIKHNYETEE